MVKLAGRAEPVVASLTGTGADADFRVDIRLGVAGPNADPGALALPSGFHAGDAVLLGLLGGAVPADAERLAIEGGGTGDRAWRRGGDLLLLTRAHLLSPGPLAAERGPGGRWAYRLANTPLVLVSAGGLARRLSLSATERMSIGRRPAMRTDALYIGVLLALLWAAGLAAPILTGPAASQVPDNRDLRLDPEDSVPPAYRDTLDERDRQRLDAARDAGETFIPVIQGPGTAPEAPASAAAGPAPARAAPTPPRPAYEGYRQPEPAAPRGSRSDERAAGDLGPRVSGPRV